MQSGFVDPWELRAVFPVLPNAGQSWSFVRPWLHPASRFPWPFRQGAFAGSPLLGQETSFKYRTRLGILSVMTRPCRELPIAHVTRSMRLSVQSQNPVAEYSAHQHSHGGRLRDEGYRHRSRQELKVAGFVCCRMNDMKADEDRPRGSLFEGGYRVSWKTPLFSTLNHVQLNRSIIS